jgi:hypothetical protein
LILSAIFRSETHSVYLLERACDQLAGHFFGRSGGRSTKPGSKRLTTKSPLVRKADN